MDLYKCYTCYVAYNMLLLHLIFASTNYAVDLLIKHISIP